MSELYLQLDVPPVLTGSPIPTTVNLRLTELETAIGNTASYQNGTIIFGDGAGDEAGDAQRPQDHIVVTALVSSVLNSSGMQSDGFGSYYEIVATGAAGSSSGYIEFEIGYDQQQFNGDRVFLAIDCSNPANLMSVAAYLGVMSNYATNANQSLTIASGSNGAFNGRMHLEFRSDGWTKVGFAGAVEAQNFKRLRFYFVLRQAQPITIKVRQATVGSGMRKGRLAVMADDYFHSFVRRAAPILQSRGIPSSLAIIPASVGTLTAAVTLPELKRYVDSGNECICHGPSTGTNWFAAPYTTPALRLADVNIARDYINNNRLGNSFAANSVAYPQGVWQSGSYEVDFLDALIADGFKLGRTTGTSGPNGRYFQRRGMRPDSHTRMLLPTIGHSYAGAANKANDATETSNIATLLGYVQAIGDQGLDGILVFHDIVNDGAANQSYHCEMSRLIALADGIKTHVSNGIVEIVKISDFARQAQ